MEIFKGPHLLDSVQALTSTDMNTTKLARYRQGELALMSIFWIISELPDTYHAIPYHAGWILD